MRIPHSVPRDAHFSVAEHQILISFESDDAALAFSDWWSYEGGSETFAEWVQSMQIREARYPSVKIEESPIISWDEEDEEESFE